MMIKKINKYKLQKSPLKIENRFSRCYPEILSIFTNKKKNMNQPYFIKFVFKIIFYFLI